MNYAPGGMFGGMYGQMPRMSGDDWNAQRGMRERELRDDMGGQFTMPARFPGLMQTTSAGGWNTAQAGGYGGMPSQAAMNSDAMMRQNFMRGGMGRFGGRGMFGGFQGGPQTSMGSFADPRVQQFNRQIPMEGGGGWPQTGGNQFNLGAPRQIPQMSNPYQVSQEPQAPQIQAPEMSRPHQLNQGLLQQQAPVQQARPQQSFEDFASTLSGSGMSSGQMNDLYQQQLQKTAAPPTNFWQNTGVGTQKPNGFVTPPSWGQQTYGFDPMSMVGKTVGRDMGWYYGMDSVGRQVNNRGEAVPTFRTPADGYQRRAPWQL